MIQPWTDLFPRKTRNQLCRPLLIRAEAVRGRSDWPQDQQAAGICERLGIAGAHPESPPGKRERQRVLARSSQYDTLIRSHLQQRPDLIVINLGAALDTRFTRLDNGRLRWYDIDMPDIIHLRKALLPVNDRVKPIGLSVFDEVWPSMVTFEQTDQLVFLAEDFFPYHTDTEIRLLLERLARIFPGSVLYGDFISRMVVRKRTSGYVSFLRNPADIEKIGLLEVGQVWPVGALYPDRQPAFIRLMNRIPLWRDAVQIVKICFKA